MSCFLCGSQAEWLEYESPRLRVKLCESCGHRQAEHSAQAPAGDYYELAPAQEKYVASLLFTRKRQARELLRRLLPRISRDAVWLDFGCGRGMFLEEARNAGLSRPAGFEASSMAQDWMRERGLTVAASAPGEIWPDWKSLPEAPKVVSFLDVLEHLRGEEALRSASRIVKELPALEWLVIKVPVSRGLLFRLARIFRGVVPGLYETLFQVGTNPPHFHYFSARSLRAFAERAGVRAELAWTDPDVDNLFHRIPSLSWLPGGRLAALALRLFPRDSAILCGRVGKA